jgi:hypothetical protein
MGMSLRVVSVFAGFGLPSEVISVAVRWCLMLRRTKERQNATVPWQISFRPS